MKKQTKRASLIGFGQLDFERMRLGKPLVGQQLKTRHVAAVMLAKKLQHVIAVLVPCARQRARTPAGYDLEFWKWRIAGKILVRVNIEITGMVDRQQPDLIEIDHFFER